jgi:hypothetical protein
LLSCGSGEGGLWFGPGVAFEIAGVDAHADAGPTNADLSVTSSRLSAARR